MENIDIRKRLTKDAQALIAVLYKDYLERRKNGDTKAHAKMHPGGVNGVHRNLMPKWSIQDIEETCRELDRSGFLDAKYADNRVYMMHLSDSGIIFMENQFADGLNSVIQFLAALKSIVPFV